MRWKKFGVEVGVRAKVEQVDANNVDADPEGRGKGHKALDQGVPDEGL